jgi:transmembrane 9 superfamily protein 2/4
MGIFFLINIVLKFEESSAAVHPHTLIELTVYWFGVSTPLVFLGAFVGYKRQKIQNPC